MVAFLAGIFSISRAAFPRRLWFVLGCLILFTACQGTKSLTSGERRSLRQQVEESPIFSKSFTGFALYDPQTREWLYQHQANKYFTPASNTKILTLYTALQVLGDSLPVLHYERRLDSLIIWGTGYPALLDPTLPIADGVVAWLQRQPGQIFLSDHHFDDGRFGSGWAWDDYLYRYQPERAAMPLYGNLLRVSRAGIQQVPAVVPGLFLATLGYDPQLPDERPLIRREEHENIFHLNAKALRGDSYSRELPFIYRPELAASLLQDTLHRQVRYLADFQPRQARTLAIVRPDTIYQRLMQQSDNFIAEQLLLMASDKLWNRMNTGLMIDYAQDSLLSDVPDKLEWVDGSGLSRYNLFTPRSLVYVLEQLYQAYPTDWLLSLFPAGGDSGTISNWYAPPAGVPPYVYAKTGTLRHRHCLSGYVRTRSGRLLIFSFMHNNFTGSSSPLKKEMDQVLRWVYENL